MVDIDGAKVGVMDVLVGTANGETLGINVGVSVGVVERSDGVTVGMTEGVTVGVTLAFLDGVQSDMVVGKTVGVKVGTNNRSCGWYNRGSGGRNTTNG